METITQMGKIIEVLPAGSISGKLTVSDKRMKANRSENRISTKDKEKTSDFIEFGRAMLKGRSLLWNNKPVIGFYIIFSINAGLRVSDILRLKHSDLANLKPGDILRIRENKTKKIREINFNNNMFQAYQDLQKKLQEARNYKSEGFIFTSQKGGVYCTVSLNRILKQTFDGYAKNISTHSLRKSYGRFYYEAHGKTEDALLNLSLIFNHSNLRITRIYLGIKREQLIQSTMVFDNWEKISY